MCRNGSIGTAAQEWLCDLRRGVGAKRFGQSRQQEVAGVCGGRCYGISIVKLLTPQGLGDWNQLAPYASMLLAIAESEKNFTGARQLLSQLRDQFPGNPRLPKSSPGWTLEHTEESMSTLTRIQLVLALVLCGTALALPVWPQVHPIDAAHSVITVHVFQIRSVLSIRRQPRNTGSYIRRLAGRDRTARRAGHRCTKADGLRPKFDSGKEPRSAATDAWARGS